MKRIYAEEDIDWSDPIFWLQTSSSIVSVYLTFTGLVCEMPMLVYETERPPIRSLSYTYTKVLPLVVLGATPQLLTLIGLGSFVTFEDILFYIPYGLVYGGMLGAGNIAIKCWMKKTYPVIAEKSSVSTLIDLGLITAVICPTVIGVFDSGFLIITSLTTTTIHSLALGALCLFGRLQPEWVFHSDLTNQTQDVSLNFTESQVEEEEQYEKIFGYLQWYTLILIPTILLFSNLIAWGIQKVFMAMNDLYLAVWACEADRAEMVQGKTSISNKLSDLVPVDEQNNTLIQYCSQRNDEISAQLCASQISKHPNYGILSSRIIISNLHKTTKTIKESRASRNNNIK